MVRSSIVEELCFFKEFRLGDSKFSYVDLPSFLEGDRTRLGRLPFTLRILLENALRNMGPGWASRQEVDSVAAWQPGHSITVPLRVSRIVLPDSSGLPALIDLAALRHEVARQGHDPRGVQPLVPVDLVIDHSVMVDFYGSRDALSLNMKREFERNGERYRFFKWAQQAFDNLSVVPPGMGIIHQIHLERLARIVDTTVIGDRCVAFPEFVLGGDSHTPMVNGLGVLAWGVGGVEAEAAMLGEPYLATVPRIIGVRLTGSLPQGSTTTDLVLQVTERLRQANIVGAFVEFTGSGCATLAVPDRATIANMAPEYGVTAAFFPVDVQTLAYLRQTGRIDTAVALTEAYCRAAGLFREPDDSEPRFDEVVEIDLNTVEPCVAGPRRPQDRVPLAELASSFRAALVAPRPGGYGLTPEATTKRFALVASDRGELRHGAIAIAAITACTNTSNPSVMLAAGLLARNAVRAGLKVPRYVKTSLAPGSRVVTRYLEESGLLAPLEVLGFHVVGYGCTTCSGKSGMLTDEISSLIEEQGLITAAVVSSNRNFEGRIHRQIQAAYLASPPLVIAYALAGQVDIDLIAEPLGIDHGGHPVFLRDIWPKASEVADLIDGTRNPAMYSQNYAGLFDGTEQWQSLEAPLGPLYPWVSSSTYILEPPFFSPERMGFSGTLPDRIEDARVLCMFGDSFSTDHIAPGGEIPRESEAGRFLLAAGVAPADFNAYTMRRGNHHILARGIFAHARTLNLMVSDRPGGFAVKLPEQRISSVYETAVAYRAEGTPVIVIGGRDYGVGSSRDWAAKGPRLLGVRCVIAESFERIHRSNLIALGIVPLTFGEGEGRATLRLTGRETYTINGLLEGIRQGSQIDVTARGEDGQTLRFQVTAFLSKMEAEVLEAGGMFSRVLAKTLGALCSYQGAP